MTAIAPPNPAPAALLLAAGKHLSTEARDEILTLGPVAVPALLAVLESRYFWQEDAPGAGWAPFHAVELLGELKAVEAVGPLLAALEATGWNDCLHDAVIRVLPVLGAPVLEPALAAYARVNDEDFKHSVMAVVAELGVRDDRVLALLLDQLRADPSRAGGNLATYGDPKALKHLTARVRA